MSARAGAALLAALLALRTASPFAAAAAAPQTDADASGAGATPSLSADQQSAVGLELRRPVEVTLPQERHAFGIVLDAAAALADLDTRAAADARRRAAEAEEARLSALYHGGAGASLKALEAARAALAGARGDAESAAARFAERWAPLDSLAANRCRRLVVAAAHGREALLRAELPGQHAVGALPSAALVDVDGMRVRGRVLGAMRAAGGTQSAALLISVRDAPAGLGTGSRLPVSLVWARRSGRMIPSDAIVYGPDGAFVYRRLPPVAAGRNRFEAVKVRLIEAYGGGWLVDGLASSDEIVVHGAGVLWSLQGLGERAGDDDED